MVTTLGLTHLDFDVEGGEQGDVTTYTRRNTALAALQKANPGLTISFTLPATPNGLDSGSIGLLNDAIAKGVNFNIVNIMTMDYGNASVNEATNTISSANGLFNQLQQMLPSKTSSQLWGMIGITDMIGQNDDSEIFTMSDGAKVLSFANTNQIGELSFWAISRDNGSCPGATVGSDTCDGLSQASYAFTNSWKSFSTGATSSPPAPPKGTPPAQLPECDPTQIVTDQCVIYLNNPHVDAVSCTPTFSNTTFIAFDCTDTYVATTGYRGATIGVRSYTLSCKIPTSDVLQNVHVACTNTDKKLSATVCEYDSYKEISICSKSNADACFLQSLNPAPPDPLTGLPLFPTPTPTANATATPPAVCAVAVTACTGVSSGQPDQHDLLLGSVSGLLVATSPADTYNSSITYKFWLIAAGLALALLAIPCALAGYQIMLGFSSVNRANAI